MSDITQDTATNTRSIKTTAGFTVIDRKIRNDHNFQIYVDYGTTTGGPWLKFGLNDTEYGLGFLPISAANPAHAKPNISAVPDPVTI